MMACDEVSALVAHPVDAESLGVSVALCTFNGERFIGEQIRSICLQSLRPGEIVLSDDASHDATIKLAEQTLAQCNQQTASAPVVLRVLRNVRALGITRNFEQAVRACRGELIVLCDQDDIWQPEKMKRMVAKFAQRRDLLLLHSDAELVDAGGRSMGHTLFESLEVSPLEIERIHNGKAFDVLLRRNMVTGATVMFRRTLLNDALPFPPEWLHDEWLAVVAAAVGAVDVVAAVLVDYRQHGGNQVGARRLTLLGKMGKAFQPRGARYQARWNKAVILERRLTELTGQVAPLVITKIRGKVEHEHFRATLPAARTGRVAAVFREIMSGRYDKFGQGRYNVLRDLLEPA